MDVFTHPPTFDPRAQLLLHSPTGPSACMQGVGVAAH